MKDKKEIVEYINSLKGYQGYVQFSDTKIRECDLFKDLQDINLSLTDGFIYEAHFYSKEKNQSIQIRQINDSWIISKTDISNVDKTDTQVFISDIQDCSNIKMAQIWENEEDELCENMKVKKLKKVVFAGFVLSKKDKKLKEIKQNNLQLEEKYTPAQKEILLNHFLKMFDDNYISNILGDKS